MHEHSRAKDVKVEPALLSYPHHAYKSDPDIDWPSFKKTCDAAATRQKFFLHDSSRKKGLIDIFPSNSLTIEKNSKHLQSYHQDSF